MYNRQATDRGFRNRAHHTFGTEQIIRSRITKSWYYVQPVCCAVCFVSAIFRIRHSMSYQKRKFWFDTECRPRITQKVFYRQGMLLDSKCKLIDKLIDIHDQWSEIASRG